MASHRRAGYWTRHEELFQSSRTGIRQPTHQPEITAGGQNHADKSTGMLAQEAHARENVITLAGPVTLNMEFSCVLQKCAL